MTASVTVLMRSVAAMTDDARASAVPLAEALARTWPNDAHFVAYEPRTVPVEGEDRRAVVRLLHEEHEERPAAYDVLDVLDVPNVRMVALVGDIDAPGKNPSPEWRADMRSRFEAAGLAYYETRGGFRTLSTIDYTITTREEAAEWTRLYEGWCEYMASEHGLTFDRACKDWTRLYRLPNVKRDGKVERAAVVGTIRPWQPHEYREPAKATATAPKSANADDAKLERARAMAERLPPSVEHHGGDEALMIAARELATVLHSNADAIESVLAGTFNPRCQPPWDAAKLKREATRAAERHVKRAADPVANALSRMRERASPAPHDHPLGRRVSLTTPIEPVRYLAEALGLAWAGKVAAIHGYAGTSKGFLLGLVALHVASGRDMFGKPVARVPVLYVDAETEPLASNRMKRLARGMGIDLAELERDGWITFVDAHGDLPTLMLAIGAELEKLNIANGGNGALLCLDSYSSMVSGDENKSEYADPMWELGQTLRQAGAVGLVTMHERKSQAAGNVKPNPLEGISGTNRLAAALVTSIRMTREDDAVECRLLVTSTRAPEKRFAPFYVTWTDRPDGAIVAAVESATMATEQEKRKQRVQAKEDKLRATVSANADAIERCLAQPANVTGVKVRDVRETLHLNGVEWRKAWAECQRRGTAENTPGGGGIRAVNRAPSAPVPIGRLLARRPSR